MVVQTKYVEVDREELRELREESAELARLRAQPARQVGAGERTYDQGIQAAFDLVKLAACNTDNEQFAARLHDLADDIIEEAPTYKAKWKDITQLCTEIAEMKRAALAPAAAGVIPDHDEYHQIAFEIGGAEDGAYHFEADELDAFVTRLNRCSIPVGLLERIADNLESTSRHRPCTSQAHCLLTELRALLGKD